MGGWANESTAYHKLRRDTFGDLRSDGDALVYIKKTVYQICDDDWILLGSIRRWDETG